MAIKFFAETRFRAVCVEHDFRVDIVYCNSLLWLLPDQTRVPWPLVTLAVTLSQWGELMCEVCSWITFFDTTYLHKNSFNWLFLFTSIIRCRSRQNMLHKSIMDSNNRNRLCEKKTPKHMFKPNTCFQINIQSKEKKSLKGKKWGSHTDCSWSDINEKVNGRLILLL